MPSPVERDQAPEDVHGRLAADQRLVAVPGLGPGHRVLDELSS